MSVSPMSFPTAECRFTSRGGFVGFATSPDGLNVYVAAHNDGPAHRPELWAELDPEEAATFARLVLRSIATDAEQHDIGLALAPMFARLGAADEPNFPEYDTVPGH